MDDIRHQKTPVSQLDIGMFVSELDRPWLGTPFLLQGLLIESREQIATISSLCEFVYIDGTYSVGQYYIEPEKKLHAARLPGASGIHRQSTNTDSAKKAAMNTLKGNTRFSFFEILKEIQASNQLAASMQNNGESRDVLLYISTGQDTVASLTEAGRPDETPSLAAQFKSDFSNFVSNLKYWRSKQNKSRFKNTKNPNQPMEESSVNPPSGFGNTITEESVTVEQEIATIYPAFEQTQIATREMFEALALDQKIDLTKVDEALNSMVESIERNPDALIWLAKLKQTDNYSYNHALNVSITLMALASFLSLSKRQVKDLGLTGLLQDIGKVKIPAALLQKEGKITDDEYELLKKHVNYATELLETIKKIPSAIIQTIAQHHERMDGSGYPFKLSGKQISLAGHLAGLVDTYCAITSTKPYAKGVYNQIALEKIQKLRGTKFNGVLVDQLVQFMGMYPVSTLVELNSGEIAVVIQQNSVRRLLPRVMVLLNPDKSRNKFPPTINLINAPNTPAGEPYRIVRSLPPDSYGLNIGNYFD